MMQKRLKIDKTGRIVIPKRLRDALGIVPGDTLQMESTGDSITLCPLRIAPAFTKEKGVWVFYTGHPLSLTATNEILMQSRAERDERNSGFSQ